MRGAVFAGLFELAALAIIVAVWLALDLAGSQHAVAVWLGGLQ